MKVSEIDLHEHDEVVRWNGSVWEAYVEPPSPHDMLKAEVNLALDEIESMVEAIREKVEGL